MPQKKAKKAKIEKSKRPPKPASSKGAAGAAQKKAVKASAKPSSMLGNKKKPAVPALKAAKAAKPTKPVKAGKVPLAAAKKKAAEPTKEKKLAPTPPIAKQKSKTGAPVPAATPAKAGKKEVVVEVPTPRGVALLGREGKKKAKSLEAARRRCREPGCDNDHSMSGYCRLHYIKNWRKIKRKEAIIASGQLNSYVEELVSKYPDKYLDVIRQDLASEKEWSKVIVDLELETSDEEGAGEEDMDVAAEGVRSDRREFDDDSDSF